MKLVKTWADVIADIAAKASSKSALLVGPVFCHEGAYCRPVMFASRERAVSVIAVAFDVTPPSAADTAEFTSLARAAFERVTFYPSDLELAKAAQRLWPSAAADALVDQALKA